MHDDTPVMVEWYTHRYIPSRRHAVIVRYARALQWADQGFIITIRAVDPMLLNMFKIP